MERTTEWRATVTDLYRVPQGKAELVGGRLVIMEPTGALPAYAGGEIFASLRAYARRTGRGHALPDNAAFLLDLPHRGSFSPDAAYYLGDLSMRFADGAPALAAEVRSEGDHGPVAEPAVPGWRMRVDDLFVADASPPGR